MVQNNLQTGHQRCKSQQSETTLAICQFTATPPAGGSFTTTTQSEMEHIGHSAHNNTTQTWTYSTTLHIRTTLGQHHEQRTPTDERLSMSYTYLIDDEVTSTPTLATDGTHININNAAPISGRTDESSLDNIADAGGVGPDYAECFWNTNPTRISILQQHH